MRWRHWCSLLLSLVSSWAGAQPLAPAVCADPASTMLWQVQGAELDKRGVSVHLLGSIHVGKPDFYPLPAVVDKAFRAADTLVFEVDPRTMESPTAAATMMQRAALPPGQTLDKVLDVDTMQSLTAVLGKLGMPVAMVNQMKPWMVTLLLTTFQVQALGYNPAFGVETYLMGQKPPATAIAELETLDSQLSLLETLDQSVFLQYSLQDYENTTAQMESMVAAWRCGDHANLANIMLAEPDAGELSAQEQVALDALMHRMFDERNAGMASKIDQFIKTGKGDYFVVVGAGHLLGDQSVVTLLQQKGYTVKPVRKQ
jgi:uncharacterized protein YbaP (TraB family)